MADQAWGQDLVAAGDTVSTIKKQRELDNAGAHCSLLFGQEPHGMVLPTLRVGLPYYVKLPWKKPSLTHPEVCFHGDAKSM